MQDGGADVDGQQAQRPGIAQRSPHLHVTWHRLTAVPTLDAKLDGFDVDRRQALAAHSTSPACGGHKGIH